jgi:predicted DNA-binding transcriptional regulator YafY
VANLVVLQFAYRDGEGKGSLRRVTAASMSYAGGGSLLRAYDVGREQFRTFQVKRIVNAITIVEPDAVATPDAYEEAAEAPPF